MSPPIRRGDGTGLNAKGYSEIRKGDGTVLWNAIPDSVVAQYQATSWSQGDATWADQATADGAQDISLTGGPQATTLSDGVESVEFDGTDDYGTHTVPISGTGLSEFTLEIAVQWANDTDQEAYSVGDNNQVVQFRQNIGNGFNSDPGNFGFRVQDRDGNALMVNLDESLSPLNDGARHDLTFAVNDATTNDITVILDGTTLADADLNYHFEQNPDNFGSWNIDMTIGGGNIDGTIFMANVLFGAVRWHDTAITEQTIDQYPF